MYTYSGTNMFSSYLRRQSKFILAAVFAIVFMVCLQRTFLPELNSGILVLETSYHPPGAYLYSTHRVASSHSSSKSPSNSTNSTIGFGAIVAVSAPQSTRRPSLLWAANLTGLEIVIPEQPSWTDDDLEAFRKKDDSRIDKGSAMAWLGHLNALKWFLGTGLETALIIEDDADWDVSVRREQVWAAREGLREALEWEKEEREERGTWRAKRWSKTVMKNKVDKNRDPHFWSNTSTWEILHLGHSPEPLSPHLFHRIHSHPYALYPDPSIPSRTSLDANTQELFHNLAIPAQTRLWHRSYWPLGSFAYAVTRASATKLLTHYGTEKTVAWDVALLEACRDNEWICWTLEPGLFMEAGGVGSVIASVNKGGDVTMDANSEEMPGDEKVDGSTTKTPKTVNIKCSVRQPGLWVAEEDVLGRKEMVERVEKGFCPDALPLGRIPLLKL